MAGQKDWHVARHAQENDFVFVTNNAADFRALYATQELHPGLVIPAVAGEGLEGAHYCPSRASRAVARAMLLAFA
jgi:hypothetical protein